MPFDLPMRRFSEKARRVSVPARSRVSEAPGTYRQCYDFLRRAGCLTTVYFWRVSRLSCHDELMTLYELNEPFGTQVRFAWCAATDAASSNHFRAKYTPSLGTWARLTPHLRRSVLCTTSRPLLPGYIAFSG